ncbi:MAG: hypothetical protein KDA42_02135 [Planctomycetales bacterium]|nr:hypothetical protein [Planctomycetales bacterium]
MPVIETTASPSPRPAPFPLLELLRQGAGIGLFLGFAISLIADVEYFEAVVASMLISCTAWPLLIGLIFATCDSKSPEARAAGLLAKAVGGLILLAAMAAAALMIGMKFWLDFDR